MTELPPAKKHAIGLFKAWSSGLSMDDCLPVDCKSLAEGLGIKVEGFDIEDDFQGMLSIEGDFKAILYNSCIREEGRINFTIAHELGHYSLHRDRKELKCSLDDLENMGNLQPHSKNIEREANVFASYLLMPGQDVRQQIKDNAIDIALMKRLSGRYQTSVTATACRVAYLANQPIAIIVVSYDGRVKWSWRNQLFAEIFIERGVKPEGLYLTDQDSQEPVLSKVWLPPEKTYLWELTQSMMLMPTYGQALIVLGGQRIY
jgi:Zn-dependent peptidase ImmA (M78 family)